MADAPTRVELSQIERYRFETTFPGTPFGAIVVDEPAPIRTRVEVEVGRNERGRLRVRSLSVQIATYPLDEADRPRFDHCLEIFEDFCTVSGAVRAGIPIATHVGPSLP